MDHSTSLNDSVTAGDRVRLAPVEEKELAVMQEWFIAGGPERLTCRPYKIRTPEELIERFRRRQTDDDKQMYAVRLKEGDRLAGRVSWFDWNPRNRTVEIGFIIAPEYRGRGFAKQAVGLLLELLFKGKKINKAIAQTGAFNDGAIALLKSIGFTQYGRLPRHHSVGDALHDDLIFGLTTEDYR